MKFMGGHCRKHLELDVDLELDLHLDLHLDLDLDLNLGQWLSRPVWCKFQCGKDDILVMKFRGAHFRRNLELDLDLEVDLELDLELDLDLDLDLDLHLDLDSKTLIIAKRGVEIH